MKILITENWQYYKKATFCRFEHVSGCDFTIERSDSFCLGRQPQAGPGDDPILPNPKSVLTFIQKPRGVSPNGSLRAEACRRTALRTSPSLFSPTSQSQSRVENKLQVDLHSHNQPGPSNHPEPQERRCVCVDQAHNLRTHFLALNKPNKHFEWLTEPH